MSRFNCTDCVKDGTDACPFGANKRHDYSADCDDLLVEENHSYEKAIDDFVETFKYYAGFISVFLRNNGKTILAKEIDDVNAVAEKLKRGNS